MDRASRDAEARRGAILIRSVAVYGESAVYGVSANAPEARQRQLAGSWQTLAPILRSRGPTSPPTTHPVGKTEDSEGTCTHSRGLSEK